MRIFTKEKKIDLLNNFVLILILLIFVSIMFYCGYKVFNTPLLVSKSFYKIILISSLLFSLLFFIIITKLNTNLKTYVSIISVSVIISLYSFEVYLQFL